MKNALELVLSPVCSIPITRRARIAGDILTCSLHLKSLPGEEAALNLFPCFLVRHRLHEGPKDAWEQFDGIIAQVLQDEVLKHVPMSDTVDVMKVLCSETWGASGNGVRVREVIYSVQVLCTNRWVEFRICVSTQRPCESGDQY